MKAMWRTLIAVMIFVLAMILLYPLWQQKDFGSVPEVAGPIALVMVALMLGLAGWYLWVTNKKFSNSPEDNPEAEIAEGAGDYGFFTPYSWWPLFLGFSAAGLFAGLAVGWWLFMIFVVTGAISLVGWTFEAYKGENAN